MGVSKNRLIGSYGDNVGGFNIFRYIVEGSFDSYSWQILQTKQHFISFIAFVTSDRIQMVKLYPEGNAQTRLPLRRMGILYWYCNRHGLMRARVHKGKIK